MKNVIHIYGASGCGTTSLGKKICDELGYKLMDTDEYYWLPTNPPYKKKRKADERVELMKQDIIESDNVVISGEIVGWGDELVPYFTLAVRLELAQQIRLERLKIREKNRFGGRIEKGGDMYEHHLQFMEWAGQYDYGGLEMRSKMQHDKWEEKLLCKKIVLDSINDVETNFKEVQNALVQ